MSPIAEQLSPEDAEKWAKTYTYGDLSELQAKILAAVECQEVWEFHDEPWIRFEPTLKAIREVTG